ncbi:hypothetical protein AVEN_101211-1 [Araneus ventricosus]|uniref:Uncharacterized protein n=1 Tax=Araneus ventricosus TaxID=182803 RepID=A0A4Y2K5S5_ARAVE|nr:hypothetical protein AVEN_101211-1 [Araneus ventricosus]
MNVSNRVVVLISYPSRNYEKSSKCLQTLVSLYLRLRNYDEAKVKPGTLMWRQALKSVLQECGSIRRALIGAVSITKRKVYDKRRLKRVSCNLPPEDGLDVEIAKPYHRSGRRRNVPESSLLAVLDRDDLTPSPFSPRSVISELYARLPEYILMKQDFGFNGKIAIGHVSSDAADKFKHHY